MSDSSPGEWKKNIAPYILFAEVSGSPLYLTLRVRQPISARISINSLPYYSVFAQCLKFNGLSNVKIGLLGLVLSISTMVLYSPSLPLYEVDAIAIRSPFCQFTAYDKVTFVSPGREVYSRTVQVGTFGIPWKSIVPYRTPITLFP